MRLPLVLLRSNASGDEPIAEARSGPPITAVTTGAPLALSRDRIGRGQLVVPSDEAYRPGKRRRDSGAAASLGDGLVVQELP